MAATATLNGHVLVLSGRLVGPDLDAVTEIGKQLLVRPERQLTVDLSHAEDTLDIAGIQWLVTIYRSAKNHGKQLSFTGISQSQRDALNRKSVV
mgnify:CR=1 FL=1